ncbi:MAG: hypothetical protein AB1568_13120 [Thermodesulfobacteriota bacterium]
MHRTTALAGFLLLACAGIPLAAGGAQPAADMQAVMEKHIESVKRSNPHKYQEMLEKAGEVIRDCSSCHTDI